MSKKTTLIHFVRHGEVENPKSIRYGRLPGYHLNEVGRRQVEQAAQFFSDRTISHIYSSPLERGQQTATLLGLAMPETPITLDPRLIETKTAPVFEGKSRDLVFTVPDSPKPDAESKSEIAQRMEAFLEEKTIKHHGQEIIAVTHGDPIALIYTSMVYNQETVPTDFYPVYASILSFVMEGLTLKQVWYRHQTI